MNSGGFLPSREATFIAKLKKKIPPKATISVTITGNRKMIDFKSFVRRAMLGGKYN